MRPGRGFTLLEVLVALAVVAFALVALVRLGAFQLDVAARVRDTAIAGWVADNALAELRLREPFPGIGRREGEVEMAGRRWHYDLVVQGTPEPALRRIDVRVRPQPRSGEPLDEDAPSVVTRVGFVGQGT